MTVFALPSVNPIITLTFDIGRVPCRPCRPAYWPAGTLANTGKRTAHLCRSVLTTRAHYVTLHSCTVSQSTHISQDPAFHVRQGSTNQSRPPAPVVYTCTVTHLLPCPLWLCTSAGFLTKRQGTWSALGIPGPCPVHTWVQSLSCWLQPVAPSGELFQEADYVD